MLLLILLKKTKDTLITEKENFRATAGGQAGEKIFNLFQTILRILKVSFNIKWYFKYKKNKRYFNCRKEKFPDD